MPTLGLPSRNCPPRCFRQTSDGSASGWARWWTHWRCPLRGQRSRWLSRCHWASCLRATQRPIRFAYQLARFILNLLRSVPELIMGIILVAMVGFGALPGVLALAFIPSAWWKILCRKYRACRSKANRGGDVRRRNTDAGDLARRAAAGNAAACRHHDLPLGIQFSGFNRAGRRWCRRYRLRVDCRAASCWSTPRSLPF